MVLDASLLNTQHYKVRIKGKVEQSWEGVAPSPTPWCSSYRKGSLRVTLDYGLQLYFTFYPALPKVPHCLVSYSGDSLGFLTPLQISSRCILQPQPTGQKREREGERERESQSEWKWGQSFIIMSCHQQVYPWPFLATSPNRSSLPAGSQGYIQYPHRSAVCRFELVVLLSLSHVKGSTGVHHLWARPYFSSSVLYVCFV